ncbi:MULTISPECIES: ABC transporter substrate-binding protein [Aliiglaciecola]|uniref:ABC transporter substrate-binding protein n=1 Tax=Aliiglaciecola TaxID=1406885 RepID=UPI001C0A63A8|nr:MULTISPECIES: extracellular solute-binding protein [Aliiglaciecola]MBU2876593.1 extracellular solute-binding protein [Aliiglaciecola lipolytica]MDO6711472.1 extracellular solute-binding protein [Aliiglaciecola sp. 2_MG-2023]MDO6752551.1 extracellular solute-binding protein [Aliiglaciecola sp. 1_MG-2023]
MEKNPKLLDKTKRNTLKTLAKSGASAVLLSKAPYVFARTKTVLKVLGTHVTLQNELREQAMQDLGIDLVFEARGSAAVMQKASMDPSSFDLYEQWSNSINVLWAAGAIQAIDKNRITHWNEINSLTKTGKITDSAKIGAGDAPFKILHVQDDGSLGTDHTDKISFLPYVHNVDSFGYNTNKIPQGVPYETESWGWLLDAKNRGKVGIVNAPTIGIFDLALAAQAQGVLTFNDIGAMSKRELDILFDYLIDLKHQNHFSGFWTSVPESVDFMRSDRVHIESMFSPAVSALNGQNVPVSFAAPKEGYRGWHGVMCMSSAISASKKDAAYDYMNWWLSGWPGAFIAKQGYYISNPQRSAKFLSQAEWDYWYRGLAAIHDLQGTDGNISVKKGDIRSGGNYETRFSNVAVWNTVMPTYDYSLQKWYEFISS